MNTLLRSELERAIKTYNLIIHSLRKEVFTFSGARVVALLWLIAALTVEEFDLGFLHIYTSIIFFIAASCFFQPNIRVRWIGLIYICIAVLYLPIFIEYLPMNFWLVTNFVAVALVVLSFWTGNND